MTTSSSAGLSRLALPFPSGVSPDLDRARSRHLAWVAERGLWPDVKAEAAYRAADFPQFAARTHPWAQGADLDLVTDLICWSWLWDDSLDRPGPQRADVARTAHALDTYRDVLHGRPARSQGDPLVDVWRELVDRLCERTSATWRQRHTMHWETTLDGFDREARNNARANTPDFDEYVVLRRATSGTDICLDWAEAIAPYELPEQVHLSPYVLRLRQTENLVIFIVNDIFSARNEKDAGNSVNIVHCLSHQNKCTWAEAVRQAQVIINSTVSEFQESERLLKQSSVYRKLSSAERADTDHFVSAMKYWMRGSLDWHLASPRYR